MAAMALAPIAHENLSCDGEIANMSHAEVDPFIARRLKRKRGGQVVASPESQGTHYSFALLWFQYTNLSALL